MKSDLINKLFLKDGEGTSIGAQLWGPDPINDMLKLIDADFKAIDEAEKQMNDDATKSEESMKTHEKLLEGIERDYKMMTSIDTQLQNKGLRLKKRLMNYILHLEDKILQTFSYYEFDLTPAQKAKNLYEHFIMVNPEYSSEKHSDVQVISDKDHTTGTIEVKSDTMS